MRMWVAYEHRDARGIRQIAEFGALTGLGCVKETHCHRIEFRLKLEFGSVEESRAHECRAKAGHSSLRSANRSA
jgi:hypothetical protein